MSRLQSVLRVIVVSGILLGTSCVQDSCGCTTVPPSHTEGWYGLTSLRDSVDLSLMVFDGVPSSTIEASGTVRLANGQVRALHVSGIYDNLAPAQLTFTGWLDQSLHWVRTTPSADSLYGVLRLPPG